MNLLPRIFDRVFYTAGITLGQFINGPVRNNEKGEFFKELSHDDGLSLWNKTNHCPDCFDKGCLLVKESLNRYSRIVPEHYSNYNQYYGNEYNASPFNTNKSVKSFHKCQQYCTESQNRHGSQCNNSRRYYEENNWIPTFELEKGQIPLPDQVVVFAVGTARKSDHTVSGIDRFPINVAFDLSPNGLAQWYNRLYLFLLQEREMHIEQVNDILSDKSSDIIAS